MSDATQPDRRVFYERVFDHLKVEIQRVGMEVPELEAVAVVCLYKMPDQANLPQMLIQGIEAPLVSPDQYARLAQAAIGLVHQCLLPASEGIEAVRRYAEEMARQARTSHAQARTGTPEGPGTAPAGAEA